MANVIELSLLKLEDEKAIPGLGDVIGKFMSRACAVCLDFHNHQKDVRFITDVTIHGDKLNYIFILAQWDEITLAVQKRQWGDKNVAAEWAACGIAILILFELTEYTVIAKARTGTGFDYWLGNKDNSEVELFEEEALLEISGIIKGTKGQINQRLKDKLKQTQLSANLELPVFAAVVEFSKPLVRIAKK